MQVRTNSWLIFLTSLLCAAGAHAQARPRVGLPASCLGSGPQPAFANCDSEVTETPPVRVVLLGSSTALGAGASSSGASWAGRLGAYLQTKGLEFVNASISGTATADSIARFENDVTPRSPQFVILATSIANEGLTPNNIPTILPRFLANTRTLIRMTESIGAIPILVTPMVNNAYTAKVRTALITLSSQLEAEGVEVWDFSNSLDDGTGKFLAGLSKDGTHTNDTGHQQLFDAIPATCFVAALNPPRWAPAMDYGSWKSAIGDGTPASITVSLASPALSWSVAFWMKPGNSGEVQPTLTIDDTTLQLRRTGTRLDLLQNEAILASADIPSLSTFVHIGITYQKLSGALTLYVNGAPAAASTLTTENPAGSFRIASLPAGDGDSFCRIQIYRAPLNAQDMKDLAGGRLHFKSLAANLPLTSSSGRGLVSRNPAGITTTMEGSWNWTEAGPRLGLID